MSAPSGAPDRPGGDSAATCDREPSTLVERLRDRGGAISESAADGGWRVRHFGDPRGEYRAATEGCGLVHRPDRTLARVHGRAPARMLHGILTNRIPEAPTGSGPVAGAAVYGALLTAKGRMVTDQRTLWLGADEAAGLGLDVAASASAAVLAHFARYLPPRMARIEDLGRDVALVTVVGPKAESVLAQWVDRPPRRGYRLIDGGPVAGGWLVSATLEHVAGWDVWGSPKLLAELWDALAAGGARDVGWGAWDTLRVEAGVPAFGVDMDSKTLPPEAGLMDRAFDHHKGCYTGQEVIVRIRDRGRVNWRLRALRFGDASPKAGARLFEPGGDKVRGRVTSVAQSPRFDQAIGLGYVRREAPPPTTLRLGSGDGPPVGVEALPQG